MLMVIFVKMAKYKDGNSRVAFILCELSAAGNLTRASRVSSAATRPQAI
jgi:hypothetical protein